MKFICPPMSRESLRLYAKTIRGNLGLQNTANFPAVEFLETLPSLLGDDSLYFDCVADEEWGNTNVHAFYDLEENCIKVKESIYIGACAGNGRDRMTITHECCHVLLLQYSHMKLTRSFEEYIPAYQDPEWQAKCLAGELMVPYELVGGMSAAAVANACGVSLQAAYYQLSVR